MESSAPTEDIIREAGENLIPGVPWITDLFITFLATYFESGSKRKADLNLELKKLFNYFVETLYIRTADLEGYIKGGQRSLEELETKSIDAGRSQNVTITDAQIVLHHPNLDGTLKILKREIEQLSIELAIKEAKENKEDKQNKKDKAKKGEGIIGNSHP